MKSNQIFEWKLCKQSLISAPSLFLLFFTSLTCLIYLSPSKMCILRSISINATIFSLRVSSQGNWKHLTFHFITIENSCKFFPAIHFKMKHSSYLFSVEENFVDVENMEIWEPLNIFAFIIYFNFSSIKFHSKRRDLVIFSMVYLKQ